MRNLKPADLRDMPVPPRLYVISTGVGANLLQYLFETPGAFSFLVGFEMPYAQEATEDLLGFMPEKFVSEETAWHLAHKAFQKALLSEREGPAIGVGVTAAIASNRERRGQNKVFAAIVSEKYSSVWGTNLINSTNPARRLEDDKSVRDWAWGLIAGSLGDEDWLIPDDKSDESMKALMSRPVFYEHGTRAVEIDAPTEVVLVPGAFNPAHEGHYALAHAAAKSSGLRPVFSICVQPPHKPALSAVECLKRLNQFRGCNVRFDYDPLFWDKALANPGCHFAVGADALDRFLDPKWSPVPVTNMLDAFLNMGIKFWVRGRLNGSEFETYDKVLDKHNLPAKYRTVSLFDGLSGRFDISSTELRSKS